MLGSRTVVGAARGRHVVVVPTDRDFDVVVVGHQVVGRVETAPAVGWSKRFNPRMRRAAASTRRLRLGMAGHDDVSAYVSGRDLNGATHSNKQVGKVLA